MAAVLASKARQWDRACSSARALGGVSSMATGVLQLPVTCNAQPHCCRTVGNRLLLPWQ